MSRTETAAARVSWRKLIDIHAPAERLWTVLERFLDQHDIPYRKRRVGDDFFRYSVASVNLCCARSVLPALEALAQPERFT